MRATRSTTIATYGILAVAGSVSFMLPDQLPIGSAAGAGPAPSEIHLTGIVRDFPSAHPDFGTIPAAGYGHYAGNLTLKLPADGRPAFTGGGAKVTSEWRDAAGRPIAPNLHNYFSPMSGCYGFPGLASDGPVSIWNQCVVDSFDSRLGPYGGANVGSDAQVSTNSTLSSTLQNQNSSNVYGDCFVGPGGDPGVVYTTHPTCSLSGSVSPLPVTIPMPSVTEPLLGPSVGNVRYDTGVTVISSDLHCDEFETQGSGQVLISGDVTILCEGEVGIHGNGLVVAAGSHLTMYLKQRIICAEPFNANGLPEQVTLIQLGTAPIKIQGNSGVLSGRMVAPNGSLVMTQGAEAFGTFVGGLIDLNNNATFHVDVAYSGATFPTPDVAGTTGGLAKGGIDSSATFDQWYRDIPGVNMSAAHVITLVKDVFGVYNYGTSAFHPIDGGLLGDEGDAHNRHFTYAIDARFTYESCTGQFIEFEGDDDAWIYIDGDLVMDLGGLLPGSEQHVDLDRLGLTDGQTYRMLFLYAQRQSTTAAFDLRTNIPLSTAGVYPTMSAQFD